MDNQGEEANGSSTNVGNGANFPRRRGFISSRRFHDASDEENYAAATNLANNPNTPEFFSNAVMANTPVPAPRKSNKKVIIIAIVAAVVLIGGGITALLLLPSNKPVAEKNARTLFNEFANYLLYGRENDTSDIVGEYEPYNQYFYSDRNNNDVKNYLEKSSQYYAVLNEYIVSNHSSEEIATIINEYGELLDFIYQLEGFRFLDNQSVVIAYIDNKNQINKYLDDYYSYKNDSMQKAQDYIKSYRSLIKDDFEILKKLDDAKCIDDNSYTISYLCFESDLTSDLLNQYSNLFNQKVEMVLEYDAAKRDLFADVWYLRNKLYVNSGEAK